MNISINKEFYNDYYNKPDWWFKLRYDTQYKVKSAISLINKIKINTTDIKICEFGFGSCELLFQFDKSNSIAGYEISQAAVDRANCSLAKKRYKSANFYLINEQSEIGEEKYNLIIASHVIEHIADIDSYIEMLKNHLLEDGHILIQVPINEIHKDDKHFHKFTTDSCVELFEKHGLMKIQSVENEYLFHLVENLYDDHRNNDWKLLDNTKRAIFNIFFSRLPFTVIKLIEKIPKSFLKYPPRQAVIMFKKIK